MPECQQMTRSADEGGERGRGKERKERERKRERECDEKRKVFPRKPRLEKK